MRRLLTKISVDWCAPHQLEQARMDGRPDRRPRDRRRTPGRSGCRLPGPSSPCPRRGLRWSGRDASSPRCRRS
jgi:hypothetical protein